MNLNQKKKSFFALPDSAPLVLVERSEQKIFIASAFDFIGRSSAKDCEFLKFPLLVKGEKSDYALFLTREVIKRSVPSCRSHKKIQLIAKRLMKCFSNKEYDRSEFITCLNDVADWGRIQRVKGKLKKTNSRKMNAVWKAFKQSLSDNDARYAIEKISSLKIGLGIAMITKVLRLCNPESFMVLDSVFYANLKLPLVGNQNGAIEKTSDSYDKVCKAFKDLQTEYSRANSYEELQLGDFEFAIYHLLKEALNGIKKEEEKTLNFTSE